MNESKLPKHPLFDPASRYSRMRKSVRPEYKMHGYFHWQKARAIRLGLSLPEPQEGRQRKLYSLTRDIAGVLPAVLALAVLPDGLLASGGYDGTVRVWDLASGTNRIVGKHGPDLRVTDAVDVRPVCLPRHESRFWEEGVGSLVLVREADGTRTVGLQLRLHPEEVYLMSRIHTVSCRAFLIEPEVLARLQEVVRTAFEVEPNKALVRAFEAETIGSNLDIARLLSAIPDLDGEVQGHEIQFHRLPVADEFDAFPPRQGPLTVVLAFDDPATPESAKAALQTGKEVGSRTSMPDQ